MSALQALVLPPTNTSKSFIGKTFHEMLHKESIRVTEQKNAYENTKWHFTR